MANIFNSIVDRALPENDGSFLCNKKSNGKYSLFLPLTNLGEIGSTPDQIEKTVVGNMARTYVRGRKDNPQQTMTFYVHRDNLRIAEKAKVESQEFLRVFPDFSGVKYSGSVDYKINDTSLDSAEQGELSVTITDEPIVIDNCYALIEDTAMFTSAIPEVTQLSASGTKVINVTTNPTDATVSVESDTTGTATVSYASGVLTITAVAKGTAVVTLKVEKTGYASFERTIFVIVE